MKQHGTWKTHLLLSLSCFIIAFPILFAIIKATQTRADVLSSSLFLGNQLSENLRIVWVDHHLGRYMLNSLIIAFTVTLGKTVFSLLGATALVFLKFKGKKILFPLIIFTLMLPTEVLIVGLFDLISMQPPSNIIEFINMLNPVQLLFKPTIYGFGWQGNHLAVIVPFMASATGIFLFRQHFMSIPSSLGEAAIMDGAGPFRFLRSILVPMSLNTIGALAVVQFVYVWDQYLWPRVIIRQANKQVVQVGLHLIIGTGEGVYWGQVMAAAVVSLIPPLIVFLLLQRQFIKGFALAEHK